MNTSVKLPHWLLLLSIALAFASCKKAESPNPTLSGPSSENKEVVNPYSPPAITFKNQIIGFVYDESGKPIQGAKVLGGNQTVITDNYGVFILNEAAFTGDFCYIKAEKNGYFFGSNTVYAQAGQKATTEITMQAKANQVAFAAAQGKEISLSNGSVVNFPANAVKTADGKPFTGNVNVAVGTIHPDDVNFNKLIPGGDLRAYTQAGENVQLFSFGMLNVEMYDDAGNKLQLAEGKEATLTFPIAASQMAQAQNTIPLWYFDEDKGVWIEDGIAYKKGNTYVGNVKHFTPWNIDKPENRARIKARILDCYNKPLANTTLRIGQRICKTNNNGEFNGLAFAGQDFDIEYFNKETKTYIKIFHAKGAPGNETVTDLGTLLLNDLCKTLVFAQVIDCNSKPFTGYAIVSGPGITDAVVEPIVGGSLSLSGSYASGKMQISFYSPNTNAIVVQDFFVTGKEANELSKIIVCPENTGVNQVGFQFSYTDGEKSYTHQIKNTKLAVAFYSVSKNQTSVIFIDKDNPNDSLVLNFEGKQEGVFNNTDPKKPHVTMHLGSKGLTAKSYADNIAITQMGGYGQEVKGTFKGRYVFIDNPYTIPKAIIISDGYFSAVRLPDVP